MRISRDQDLKQGAEVLSTKLDPPSPSITSSEPIEGSTLPEEAPNAVSYQGYLNFIKRRC